ncbi:DUF927 domain-containing protein [Dyella humicola]|uniref:DUF927 domain-containing protein n=1 Tax=Dyella humicola TaxID=2992126 RepID=UPI0022524279
MIQSQTSSQSAHTHKRKPPNFLSSSATVDLPSITEIIDLSLAAPSLKPAGTRFEVTIGRKGYKDGVHWIDCKNEQDGTDVDQAPTWICSPLHIGALTRDETGSEWGRLLVFDDRDRRRHQWAMPCSMLATDGADLRAELLRQGLDISSASRARKLLNDYIQQASPKVTARCVTRTGWHGDAFVLPKETYGAPQAEPIIFQTTAPDSVALGRSGTLDGWRSHVAAPCAGNSRLLLALSTGFAGPCLGLLNSEGGGVHLRGGSSLGKTTAVLVASSIFGPPEFMRTWRQTDNALEGTASLHSDLMLPLDEIGQLDPSKAGAVAYMLANGQGKGRSARDGSARAIAKFQLIFLSSGEISLGDLVTESGGKRRAGQEVRVIDMAADAGAGFGMFERLPAGLSAGEFADQLKTAARAHFGHALPALLQAVTANPEVARAKLRAIRDSLANELAGRQADGQVRRVAQRFALIGAAGELATSYGLTDWPEGEAAAAAKKCFANWQEARGTNGNSEPEALLSQVRAFFEAHGESRFEPEGRQSEKLLIRERAGFRRKGDDEHAVEYLVFPEAFKQIIEGHNQKWAIDVLIKADWLKPGKDCAPQSIRVDGLGKRARLYVFDGGAVHAGD